MRKSLVLGIGTFQPGARSSPTVDFKLRKLDPARFNQLGRVLGGGFDPARDIVAIIVNRWPHGYAYSYNSLYDPMEWVLRSVGCIRRDALRGPSAVPRIGEQ